MHILKIKNLQAQTTLGVYAWEKAAQRLVVLNIEMQVDTARAGVSDDLGDAVDYAVIEEKILACLQNATYCLLEKLVAEIGRLILSLDERIISVKVEADKPGALRMAESVSLTAILTRD